MSDNTLRPEVAYFNNKSSEYRAEYDRETPEGYSFRVRREKVLRLVPQHSTVIDIASGPGVMIAGLQNKHCSVTCVDAAPEMIARTKEEYPQAEALVGDAYQLPCANHTFDVALAMGLIEYLEHEHVFLKETARILKDGGELIITFPNYMSPWRAFNRLMLAIVSLLRKALRREKRGPVTHREYTVRGAVKLLEQAGFEAHTIRYYNFKLIPYPFDVKFPRFTVAQSKLCERLDRTLLRFIGTGFIVKAKKTAR